MKKSGIALIALSAIALAACGESKTKEAAEATATPAPEAPASALTLPVSLNAVMVGLIDHSSDYIFDIGNGKAPKTDDEWREAEYHAYQMVVGGKLIQLAGTGPKDAEWTANADWKKRSDDLSNVGMEALKFAQAKDAKGVRRQKF